MIALVVKLVDTQDLKSCLQQCKCGFKSRLGHGKGQNLLKKILSFFYCNRQKNSLALKGKM
jgi:hypothetical protein